MASANTTLPLQLLKASRKIAALNVDNRFLQESLSKLLIVNEDLMTSKYKVRFDAFAPPLPPDGSDKNKLHASGR
jgi:hypothetical protein